MGAVYTMRGGPGKTLGGWRTARSPGGAWGWALWGGATACVVILVAAGLSTGSASTRWMTLGLLLPTLVVWVVLGLGLLRWLTLEYRLGPVALEIRSAAERLRVRYDQIERVGRDLSAADAPCLWPGACFGCQPSALARLRLWRATSPGVQGRVAVETSGATYLLTPADPTGFEAALVERWRGLPAAARRPDNRGCTWIDRLGGLDTWYRAGIGAALAIGALAVALEVARYGGARPGLSVAVAALGLDAVLGLLSVERWPAVARLLAAGALAAELLAILG